MKMMRRGLLPALARRCKSSKPREAQEDLELILSRTAKQARARRPPSVPASKTVATASKTVATAPSSSSSPASSLRPPQRRKEAVLSDADLMMRPTTPAPPRRTSPAGVQADFDQIMSRTAAQAEARAEARRPQAERTLDKIVAHALAKKKAANLAASKRQAEAAAKPPKRVPPAPPEETRLLAAAEKAGADVVPDDEVGAEIVVEAKKTAHQRTLTSHHHDREKAPADEKTSATKGHDSHHHLRRPGAIHAQHETQRKIERERKQDRPLEIVVSGTTVTIGKMAGAMRTSVEVVLAALVTIGEEKNVPKIGRMRKSEISKHPVDLQVAELAFLEMGRSVVFSKKYHDKLAELERSASEAYLKGLGKEVDDAVALVKPLRPEPDTEEWSSLPLRPPVVAVMGHVDHGKTTLLDALRGGNVAASEAGGITQRLSAFRVGGSTFIDTPGHAAFARMRSSSARALDVALVVVAADDSVKPQTLEALALARDRRAAIVFAMTKVDKFLDDGGGGRPGETTNNLLEERRLAVRNDLATHGYAVEEDGGDAPLVALSAPAKIGVDDLTATLDAYAEILDLRADPAAKAEAVVVEAAHDKHLGVCADVVVTWGTLKVGDFVVVGEAFGKVRRLEGLAPEEENVIKEGSPSTKTPSTKKKPSPTKKAAGKTKGGSLATLKEATPSSPCRVVAGFHFAGDVGAIAAGDTLYACKDEKVAKKVATAKYRHRHAVESAEVERQIRLREAVAAEVAEKEAAMARLEKRKPNAPMLLKKKQPPPSSAQKKKEDASSSSQGAQPQEVVPVPVVVKVSSDGEVDAARMALAAIPTDRVKVDVVGDIGVGDVGRGDVDVAATFKTPIFAWNVRLASGGDAREAARRADVDVRRHSVIYHLMDDIKRHAASLLPPTTKTEVVGKATVLQIFDLSNGDRILGCRVTDGTLRKDHGIKVSRQDNVLYADVHGAKTLKRFKDDVQEVTKGLECGIGLHAADKAKNLKEGDVLEAFKVIEVPPEL